MDKPPGDYAHGDDLLCRPPRYAGFVLNTPSQDVYEGPGWMHPPDRVLWHYTNWNGLKGILDNHELWASNAAYLNDFTEGVLWGEIVQKFIKRYVTNLATLGSIDHRAGLASHPSLSSGSSVFVASLSEKADDLSQWRAYANPAPGFAIGFDEARLARRLANVALAPPSVSHAPLPTTTISAKLVRCLYDPVEQEQILLPIMEKFLRESRAADLGPDDPLPKGWTRHHWQLMNDVADLAPHLKHHAFRDEGETRIIVPPSGYPHVSVRQSGSLVVPYLRLQLGRREHSPIYKVVVGPGPHKELVRHSVTELLLLAGVAATVSETSVPYRNW